MTADVETREYLNQLEEAATIDAQADILHFLYNSKYTSPDFYIHLYTLIYVLILAGVQGRCLTP